MTQQTSQLIKETKDKIIGLKQTLRAIQQDMVIRVFVAGDVEEHIIRKINDSCADKQIPIVALNLSQKELGKLCEIEVGASIVALTK